MNKLDYNNWVTKGLLIAFTISLGAFLFTLHHDGKMRDDVRHLRQQLAHASVPLKVDTIRDSIPVFTEVVKQVDKTDYKKQLADRELIKDLKLELSKVVAENRMLREAKDQVPLEHVGDSVFAYHDHWADIVVNVPERTADYAVRDSFVTLIDRIPRHHFLWWSWGTKGYRVKHVNFNEKVKIRYSECILIGK